MKTIKLSRTISNYLITRNNLKSIFDRLNRLKEKDIIIDFDDISFISRSCADEYLKLKKESDKKIKELNMSKDIRAMIQLVELQRMGSYKKHEIKRESSPIVFL